MFFRTDDPIKDFENWDREQQKQLDKLPECARCDQPIQQEDAVRIGKKFYCDHCLAEMRESIGDD